MPIYVSPGNDLARLTHLSATLTAGESDSAKGELRIAQKTLNLVIDLTPQMKTVMNNVSKGKAVRAGEVVEKNRILKKLDKYVSHLWTGVKNRVDREELPVDVLKYYQLPTSGILPILRATPSSISVAESIISGEANAVAAGYAPMANPSIEELSAVVDEAKKEIKDVTEADAVLDSEEANLQKLREEADHVIKKVVADLRYFLQDEDEPSQRRIMRRYGLVFKSDKSEVAAE